jgi:ergothioneine biosynthesis protein EgtB
VALAQARARLKSLVSDLTDGQWNVPHVDGINPIAWEIGHVAWFAEWWTLRGPHHVDAAGFTAAAQPPVHAGPDALFDSSRIAHADRWKATLPARGAVLHMLDAQLDATLHALNACAPDDAGLYFHRLALFHEDMHNEALLWLRAALGYPAPQGVAMPGKQGEPAMRIVPAQVLTLGHTSGQPGFAFDNEQQGVQVKLDAFEIDTIAVTCGQLLRFVEAGGYDNPAYWPGAAGKWRSASARSHPQRWRKHSGVWQLRWFDRWIALPENAPLMHVNAHEAQAYCLWAQRQLPTAAQWEAAARVNAITWGNSVWEWTASAFEPYPGFTPGPYKDYSQPWFGSHGELRGGSFATDARMHHTQYRNFFLPERSDIFAGFRTVALP